ncbi:MAG: putative quinol monooxygenase [Pseudomonadales bacterium]|nr:antibiotic biosynthesis monooxygenase [Pseudomonadales bacterium]
MIVVNVIIDSTERDIAALKQAIAAIEAASRAESGCEDYTFSVELNDSTRLRITERWRDVQALKDHFGTEHMATFNAAIASHPPRSLVVKCYEAREIPLPR